MSRIVLLLLGTAAALAHGAAVTPLEKVTALLSKLKSDVEDEGKAEAKTYDEFACFCKDKSTATSGSILAGQDNIDSLSANLADFTATKETRQSELSAKKQEEEQLKRDLSATQVNLAKSQAAYEASDADLSKAISSLQGAIKSLQTSKGAPSEAGLLSIRRSVQKSLELADAMKLLDEAPRWHSAAAFLQQSAGVNPNDPEYKYHSQGIIEILEKLLGQFKDKKSEADGEWAKTKATLEQTIKDLNTQLDLAAAAIVDLNTAIDKLTSDIAITRGDLVQAENTLKEDQLYINDLTKLCESRAREWDQRSQQRNGELEALTKALEILTGTVAETEKVNVRALLLQRRSVDKPAQQPRKAIPSFLQSKAVRAHGGSLLARAGQQQKQQLVQSALGFLRQEGGRLRSATLSGLALRAAADPFGKVKTLIQELIERLLDEATAEASKKGFCDTELGKATQDRTFRFEATQKLNAELRQLEAKRDALTTEISDLKEAIEAVTAALVEATASRAAEKDENLANLKTAQEGLKAVKLAITVLKDFYTQASRAKVSLIQASPVDVDAPSVAQGAYKGNQEASSGVLGLLEVLKSDFERTIDQTTKSEAKAHAQFTEFDVASKADIASKTTKSELDQQDLDATESKIAVKTKDLKSNQNLLDGALLTLEELRPMCVDNGMSYEERVAKRDEEIAALKKAVCILDPEGVEPLCADP